VVWGRVRDGGMLGVIYVCLFLFFAYWREGVERGVDSILIYAIGNDAVIEQLPEEYSSSAAERAPETAARFTELSSRLKELSEKRQETKARLEAYRKVKEMVDVYGQEGGIQDNLVTKNGEVEKELERMRMLMLRVERGVEGLEARRTDREEDDMEWEEDRDQAMHVVLKQST
jgi:hypothetical protein